MSEILKYIFEDEIQNPDFKTKKMFWSFWIYYKNKFIAIFNDWEFYLKKWINDFEVFENNWKVAFSYIKKWEKCYLKNYLKLKNDYIDSPYLLEEIFKKSYF